MDEEDPDRRAVLSGNIPRPDRGWLASFVIYGYMLEILRRVYFGRTDVLPEWDDIGGYFVQGFVVSVGLFIWLLPPILLIGCVGGGIAIAGNSSGNDGLAVFSGLFAFGTISVMVLLTLIWSVAFLPIIGGRYAVEQRFGAMFEFSEIFAEVGRAGVGALLVLLLTVIIASFVGNLGFVACLIGVVFTSFYANVVMAHGAGQVYRRARGLGPDMASSQSPAF
ncbi:MAG: DUF4013 domain-containing protein [Thermomicrobiales bacterium]